MNITPENVHDLFEYRDGSLFWKISKRGIKRESKLAGTYQHGYIQVRFRKEHYYAHRIVWLMFYGEWPAQLIDHIDRDKSNNRIENLRLASKSQNNVNARRARSDSRSGYRGVHARRGRWAASIRMNGERRFLGSFASVELAAAAYDSAAREMHGEFAFQNGVVLP